MPTCEFCQWNTNKVCYRMPPTAIVNKLSYKPWVEFLSIFPRIEDNFFCGEWKEKAQGVGNDKGPVKPHQPSDARV